MSSDGKETAQKRGKTEKGISIPGQPTEEAVAEVATEAGKSLLRGLGRLGNATVDGWASTKEARAAAAKLAIETEAAIAKEKALTNAKRQDEIEEMEHRALLHRRAERFRLEFEREQRNLESIEVKAIEYTESDTENDKPRELDDDWLFKFSEFAQRISDDQVQSLWARALSSASIAGATKLSGASLQTLSLFDKDVADSFEKFSAVIATLKSYPMLRASDPQGIDLRVLEDLGLIKEQPLNTHFPLGDFGIGIPNRSHRIGESLYGLWVLTVRGAEIANAVFRARRLMLAEDLKLSYLVKFVEGQFPVLRSVEVSFTYDQQTIALAIFRGDTVGWQTERPNGVPPLLARLLEWVSNHFSIKLIK